MEVADPRPQGVPAQRGADAAAGAPEPPAALPPPHPGTPSPTAVVSMAETLLPPSPNAPTTVAQLDPQHSPMFAVERTDGSPGHRREPVAAPERTPMWPFRLIAIAGISVAFVLYGWQVFRVIDEQPRLPVLDWGPFLAGSIGALGIVVWSYLVAENARRIYAPATVSEPPQPGKAAASWLAPLVFAAGATIAVTALSRRYNTPIEGTESSYPLILAVAAILVAFPLMYWPVNYLTDVVRKVGGHGIKLGRWLLVPVTLAAVGAAMIFTLRAGGTFDEQVNGPAPTWVVGIAAIVPATVVVLLGWRATAAVESDIAAAFERRTRTNSSLRQRRGKLSKMFADNGPNHAALRTKGQIRQAPGANAIGIIVTSALAGLTLLSVVGAVVMYLFWQESRDGVLLPKQIDRAWDVLAMLQDGERTIAFVSLAVVTVWTAIAVFNVRLASARHRNPLIAALAWPAAGAGIWMVGDRLIVDGTSGQIVIGFAVQALLLYMPFIILERSADAVGARRNPLRLTAAIGVVLLVQIQGIGGLSTLSRPGDATNLGPLVGYLAVGALVQLLATIAVTDALRSLTETTTHVASRHNELVAQRDVSAARPANPYHFVAGGA